MIGQDWYRGNRDPDYRLSEAKRRLDAAHEELARAERAFNEAAREAATFHEFHRVGS